ncbi:MAG: hypothetical protein JSW63_11405 [Ignavibacterium sp.]|nr:MAG: hypothetical protein JSW63_11405 [Ignavibacterium sp.]
MKNAKFYQAIILSIILSALSLSSAQEDVEKSFTVSRGDNLKVSSSFGNITYDLTSGNQLKVIAQNVLSSELSKLKMEKRGSIIDIDFEGEDSRNFSFEITGPATINLDFSTGGGNVAINGNIEGFAEISTAGGNISTGDINGKADISTAGGNIKISNVNGDADVSTAGGDMKFGNINGTADISTGGGNIKIGSINKSADVSTGGGNISIDDIGGNADVSTGGGNIKVERVSGSADISTGGGNIKLASATGKVDVSTGGGNIRLNNIKGIVDASTGAGNITADILPESQGKSEMSTGMGNITLYVPESARVTIIATTHVMMWDEDQSKLENIKSDFEPTSVERHREARYIEAKFELNGGGPLIEVNTGMGDIELRKMN